MTATPPVTPEPLPWLEELPPRQIVAELDRYIVGQAAAKKAIAIAIRNRWRRSQAPEAIRDEITPSNIILIGPTGVGKTEIARRLARLAGAPFVKVEASKFTEVGYVGRDVGVDGARPGGCRDFAGAGRARGRGLAAGRGARDRTAAGPAAAGRGGRRRGSSAQGAPQGIAREAPAAAARRQARRSRSRDRSHADELSQPRQHAAAGRDGRPRVGVHRLADGHAAQEEEAAQRQGARGAGASWKTRSCASWSTWTKP